MPVQQFNNPVHEHKREFGFLTTIHQTSMYDDIILCYKTHRLLRILGYSPSCFLGKSQPTMYVDCIDVEL